MHLFNHFSLKSNQMVLFSLTLLLGLIGGEIANRSKFFPKISGYLAIGFLVGPGCFNLVPPSLLSDTHIFVSISLGLILFDIGRHLDFAWVKQDSGLLPTAFLDACLTFILCFIVLIIFNFSYMHAALACAIAITTSPAVIMMVINDLSAKGPIARRSLILTSLNNLFGLSLFVLLLPFSQEKFTLFIPLLAIYRLLGSFALGYFIYLVTISIAKLIGKSKTNQLVLFVGSVVLALGLSKNLHLSSMLSLFSFGVAARNFDYHYLLTEVDFGWFARIFFILLFVISGVHLQFTGLWLMPFAVFSFIIMRFFATSLSVSLFAKRSRLMPSQVLALSLSLTPMSGLAIGMANYLLDLNPNVSADFLMLLISSVAVLDLIGPVLAQIAFIKTKEAVKENVHRIEEINEHIAV